jgi:hypothetical protein
MRLELTIDNVVLDGFDARDRHRIGDAIQRELSSLRWSRDGSRRDDPPGRRPTADVDGSPQAIARAVHQSISAALAEGSVR